MSEESQDGLIDEEELNELFMDSRVTTYLEAGLQLCLHAFTS